MATTLSNDIQCIFCIVCIFCQVSSHPIICGEKTIHQNHSLAIQDKHHPSIIHVIHSNPQRIQIIHEIVLLKSIKTSQISQMFQVFGPHFSKEHFQLQFLHFSQQLSGLSPVTSRQCRGPGWVTSGPGGQGGQVLQSRGPGMTSTC